MVRTKLLVILLMVTTSTTLFTAHASMSQGTGTTELPPLPPCPGQRVEIRWNPKAAHDVVCDSDEIPPLSSSFYVRVNVESSTAPTAIASASGVMFAICFNPCSLGGWTAGPDGDGDGSPDYWNTASVVVVRMTTISDGEVTVTTSGGDSVTDRTML